MFLYGIFVNFFFIKEKILQDFKMFFFRNKLNGKSSLSGLQKVFNIITKKFIILLRFSRKKKHRSQIR